MVPDQISFDVGDRLVTIEVGELLLPVLVLVVSALYYVDTRGLPGKSLIYAEPVLYIAVILAVVTIVQHAITIRGADEAMADGIGGETTEREFLDDHQESATRSSSPFFNRKSAAVLATLIVGYISALTLLSRFVTDVTFIGLSAAFLGATLFLLGERQWTRLVAYSVGFAVLVWGVFVHWLQVPVA